MKTIKAPLITVAILYVICYVFRIAEYFCIRTDQTIIGEAFIHKLMGITLIIGALKVFHMSLHTIGFTKKGIVKYTLYGLGLGLSVFAIGYGVEVVITMLSGTFKSLDFYVSSYAVDKNVGMNTAFIFFMICIMGNILNVIMEEGVFRGLFQKLLETKYTFVISAVIASVLFGMWHAIGPIRNYLDGVSSINGTMANILMLVITSGLIGFKFAMLSHMEGALYMGMGDHFVNNTIVNLVHVTTQTGVDEMMFLRITIAQTVSFIMVLVVYLNRNKKKCCR